MGHWHGHEHAEGPWGCGRGHGFGWGRGSHGRHGFAGHPNREEWLRRLEEYQRDLEQRTADVADLIRRLKERPAEAPAETTSV